MAPSETNPSNTNPGSDGSSPEGSPSPAEAVAAEPEQADSTVPERPVFAVRGPIPDWQRWALGTIPALIILGAWTAATWGQAEMRMISPTILPSPTEVVGSFKSLWFDRELTFNAIVSFRRVLTGFAVAVAICFPLGLLMGAFTRVRAVFEPTSVFGAYLPIPTLVPLTMSLFGTGEAQKTVFLALAFMIYLLPLILGAVDKVDDVFIKTAQTLGAGRSDIVKRVLLGIAAPDIFQSLRLGFGVGWSYIILAEIVDIGKGLGGIIITSQRRGPREHIYLVLLAIVVIAWFTDKIWVFVGKRLFPYSEEFR